MLFEYFLHAQEGSVDPEALCELTGVLREVTEYSRAGKLPVPVKRIWKPCMPPPRASPPPSPAENRSPSAGD